MSSDQILATDSELSGNVDALLADLGDIEPETHTVLHTVYIFRFTDDVSIRIALDEDGATLWGPELHDECTPGCCRVYDLTPSQAEIVRDRARTAM
jgi:hypothetical protein